MTRNVSGLCGRRMDRSFMGNGMADCMNGTYAPRLTRVKPRMAAESVMIFTAPRPDQERSARCYFQGGQS